VASLPGLDLDTLPTLAAQVRPRADELRWLDIPWETSLGAGRARARRLGRPMFLWAMNGNPLGCV
jgi:hypothetical protein